MSEPTEDSVRAEVSAWLKANWKPEYGLVEWRLKLCESGWGAPHWPKQWYGRGLPVKFNSVVDEEFARIGAVGVAKAGIRTLAAATILEHGTDLHKEKFLRRILTGEDTWCQLFSEPGSGSDMAGAVTRADTDASLPFVHYERIQAGDTLQAMFNRLRIDDAAALVEHGAVQGTAVAVQALDIIGQQILEPGLGLWAADIDHGHMGNIEHPAIAAHLMVLLDLRAVMQGHVPTAKIDHLRAEGEMQVIQRRTLSHGFLLPGVAKVRTAAVRGESREIEGFQPISANGSVRRTAPNAAHCSRMIQDSLLSVSMGGAANQADDR